MIRLVCVGVFVMLTVTVDEGLSIDCYSCSSKMNESCYKPDLNRLRPVHCDRTTLDITKRHAEAIYGSYGKIFDVDLAINGQIDLVCLKVVIRDGNKDYILRGCQLAEQQHLDICKRLTDINTDTIRSMYCSKCSNENGCNSSPGTFNFSTILLFTCTALCRILYSL